MISRHFLRSKVLQLAYAAYADPVDVVVAERNYKHHIARLNDLGTTQLSTLTHFVEVASVMIDEARHKFLPTEADLNPDLRLLNNRVIRRLADNFDFHQQIKDANVTWGGVDFDAIYRQAYNELVKSAIYKDYLAAKDSFATDHDFVTNLFKFLMNYSPLCERIYPMSLLWEDDFGQIAQYQYKFLKGIDETFDEASPIPLVCDPRDPADAEAYDFARLLLINTMRHKDEVEDMIRKHLKGWEYERVAEMDILILNMAVAELTECPSIPERVTVDEYIELSKEFSAERSRLFINGILAKFIIELRSAGRIKKTGRGIADFDTDDTNANETADADIPIEELPVLVHTARKTRPRIKKTK